MEFRNIAIIAHVDHGKTTLVDGMLKQYGTFTDREVVQDCVMDSNELERERGITIYAKNTAVSFKGVKINIMDTPGHADFGSEVERVLRMVDSVLLVVDAAEGPMPQTRFVLRKSLELGLKPILVINKIDKPTARPDEVVNEVFDLMVELGANDAQLDFKHVYAIAREGMAKINMEDASTNLEPLFDLILSSVPPAPHNTEVPLRFQPAILAYDNYVGRMGVGRIYEGTAKVGMNVTVIKNDGERLTAKITKILSNQGMNKCEVSSAEAGDIVHIAGIEHIYVGDTIAEDPNAEPMPHITIDAPTIAMNMLVNNSPFAGREGTFVTSRQIRERLTRELETNVGLKVEFPESSDVFTVSGRGEMHIAVLVEQMRREGFELQLSQPQVIMREIDGVKQEPIEATVIDVPDEFAGSIIEKMGSRKGEMVSMDSKNGLTRLEYLVPTRGLLGLRADFLTLTKGEGTLSHIFSHYAPYRGEIARRTHGTIISGFTGFTAAYSLDTIQQRGPLFIGPAVEVYEGMVIGMSMKETMTVNPIKEKKQSNMRSSGADQLIKLEPPVEMSLERALEICEADEYVEATPTAIRLRKKYLTEVDRKRFDRNQN